MSPAQTEAALSLFEGLISETARQIVARGVELEAEDVRQLLRVKAWRVICAYDPASGLPLRNFVFGCLYNLRKDILKRPRRHNVSIEELRGSWQDSTFFDARYLSVDAEVVYAGVEDEPPLLPCTLTAIERQVIELRVAGRLLVEIDSELALSRAERERIMRSIRVKLADWAPSARGRRAPLAPLPQMPARLAAPA